MTDGAHVNPFGAGEGLTGHYKPGLFFIGVFGMEADVPGRGTVASFAIDSGYEGCCVQRMFILSCRLGNEGAVALETSFEYGSVEIGHAGGVSRAACPPVKVCKIRNGELIQ